MRDGNGGLERNSQTLAIITVVWNGARALSTIRGQVEGSWGVGFDFHLDFYM